MAWARRGTTPVRFHVGLAATSRASASVCRPLPRCTEKARVRWVCPHVVEPSLSLSLSSVRHLESARASFSFAKDDGRRRRQCRKTPTCVYPPRAPLAPSPPRAGRRRLVQDPADEGRPAPRRVAHHGSVRRAGRGVPRAGGPGVLRGGGSLGPETTGSRPGGGGRRRRRRPPGREQRGALLRQAGAVLAMLHVPAGLPGLDDGRRLGHAQRLVEFPGIFLRASARARVGALSQNMLRACLSRSVGLSFRGPSPTTRIVRTRR